MPFVYTAQQYDFWPSANCAWNHSGAKCYGSIYVSSFRINTLFHNPLPHACHHAHPQPLPLSLYYIKFRYSSTVAEFAKTILSLGVHLALHVHRVTITIINIILLHLNQQITKCLYTHNLACLIILSSYKSVTRAQMPLYTGWKCYEVKDEGLSPWIIDDLSVAPLGGWQVGRWLPYFCRVLLGRH